MPSLARGGCVGVGCVKAVPYKGNKKVWKNQINAEFFCLNGKYYILHITCNILLNSTLPRKREKVVYRLL